MMMTIYSLVHDYHCSLINRDKLCAPKIYYEKLPTLKISPYPVFVIKYNYLHSGFIIDNWAKQYPFHEWEKIIMDRSFLLHFDEEQLEIKTKKTNQNKLLQRKDQEWLKASIWFGNYRIHYADGRKFYKTLPKNYKTVTGQKFYHLMLKYWFDFNLFRETVFHLKFVVYESYLFQFYFGKGDNSCANSLIIHRDLESFGKSGFHIFYKLTEDEIHSNLAWCTRDGVVGRTERKNNRAGMIASQTILSTTHKHIVENTRKHSTAFMARFGPLDPQKLMVIKQEKQILIKEEKQILIKQEKQILIKEEK